MKQLPRHGGAPKNTRTGRIITPAHPEFGCAALVSNSEGDATTTWLSASDPVAIPFTLSRACVVTHLGWRNGSAAGSNHDIAIYNEQWARLVSSGSTLGAGNSIWQFVNVTDTGIPAGRHYLVKNIDAVTSNRAGRYSTALGLGLMAVLGLQDSATNAFPLPDPLTNMGNPSFQTYVPVVAFAVKAPL